MAFKIPNKIMIGGVEWAIKRDNRIEVDVGSYGTAQECTKTITLSTKVANPFELLCHEVMEAVFLQYEIKGMLGDDVPHHVINMLGLSMYSFIVNNIEDFYEPDKP